MKSLVALILFSFFVFAQEKEIKEEKKFGNLTVKVTYKQGNIKGAVDDVRVFIGEDITLNRNDIRNVRPVILIPVKDGWMYLNGKAKELKRTNRDGIVIFENLPFGKYKVIAAWWKNEAKIMEVEINKEEIEIVFEFVK